jgi:PHP family Zn ribbon phosphoesterase
MSPRNIVREAKESGLDIIGICDHNSCENVPYVQKSANNCDISVIGGIEVTSREEVHILVLFDTRDALFSMQKIIYDHLAGTNDEKLYGDQVVVNEKDEVMDFNKRLLIGATELSVENIVNSAHQLNGLAIASHIDRESFSIISQLGFIPEGLQIDALEISNKDKIDNYMNLSLPLVSFSDAHNPNYIGKSFTNFTMEQVNLEEMRKSLQGEQGRKAIF